MRIHRRTLRSMAAGRGKRIHRLAMAALTVSPRVHHRRLLHHPNLSALDLHLQAPPQKKKKKKRKKRKKRKMQGSLRWKVKLTNHGWYPHHPKHRHPAA